MPPIHHPFPDSHVTPLAAVSCENIPRFKCIAMHRDTANRGKLVIQFKRERTPTPTPYLEPSSSASTIAITTIHRHHLLPIATIQIGNMVEMTSVRERFQFHLTTTYHPSPSSLATITQRFKLNGNSFSSTIPTELGRYVWTRHTKVTM